VSRDFFGSFYEQVFPFLAVFSLYKFRQDTSVLKMNEIVNCCKIPIENERMIRNL